MTTRGKLFEVSTRVIGTELSETQVTSIWQMRMIIEVFKGTLELCQIHAKIALNQGLKCILTNGGYSTNWKTMNDGNVHKI